MVLMGVLVIMYEKKYQIFISSTYKDLIVAREKIIETILSMYHFPIGMEMFSADDDDQWQVIKDTIDQSDYYVIIIGHRYGAETSEGISYTEKEYDYAKSKGIPILAFIRDREVATKPEERDSEAEKIEKLNRFISKAEANKMRDTWFTVDGLGAKVAIALSKIFIKKPGLGWIRADKAISPEIDEVALLSKANESNELENKLKKRNIALASLRDILKMHFEAVLFGMYKAASSSEKVFSTLEELFSEEYYETVQYLDFNKSPSKDEKPKYYEIVWEHNKYTKELLTEEVLNSFGQYLEVDIFQLVQNMRLSPFIKVTQQLSNKAQFFGQFADLIKLSRISNNSVVIANGYAPNYLDSDYNEELMSSLQKHIEIFKEIVKVYNRYSQYDNKLDLLKAPNTGSVTWGCCRVDNIIKGGRQDIKVNFDK